MTVLAPCVRQQFLDLNGDPYVGGKLFSYAAGTTSKISTYTTSVGDVANTNPIILDSEGRLPHELWLSDNTAYKFVLALSTDTDPPTGGILLGDNIAGILDETTALDQWLDSALTSTYVSTTSFSTVGDNTALFLVGRRIKIIQSGSTIYGTITASSYALSITTVTVRLDSGTINASIISVLVGLISLTNTSSPSGRILTSERTSNTILDIADNANIISGTGAFTQTFQPASTLDAGWNCLYICKNGLIILDPNSSELINGATTLSLYTGDIYHITCSGSEFTANRINTSLEYNALVNGGMRVWLQGTTFTSIANNTTLAESWIYQKVGTGVADVSKTGSGISIAIDDVYHPASARLIVSTIETVAAGDFHGISNLIEGYRFVPMVSKPMILSFIVRSNKTGIYSVALRNGAFNQSCVCEYTINNADTFEQKFVQFPAAPTSGTWDYESGIGLCLIFCLCSGSTFKTSILNQWQAGNYIASTNQVNLYDVINNEIYITGVKLQTGSISTRFIYPDYDKELMACNRYFWRGLPAIQMLLSADAATRYASEVIQWPVEMRDVPDVSGSNLSGAAYTNCTLGGFGAATVSGARFYVNSVAAGNMTVVFTNGTHYFEANARLL